MKLDAQELRTLHGVYAIRDAARLGLTRGNDGYPGTPILRGLRSLLPPPFSANVKRAAGLTYGGKGARLTGLTGAAVLGWRPTRDAAQIVVEVPETRKVRSTAFVCITRSRVEDAVITRCGLTLASPARILASCAALPALGERDLMAITTTGLRRREVTLTDIATLVTAHPRMPGCRRLRKVLMQLKGGAESVKEVDTLAAIARIGFPAPQLGAWIWDGKTLISIADFWWDGIAGFFDGATHFEELPYRLDRAKRTILEAMAPQVVVVTKDMSDELLRRRLVVAFELAALRTGPPAWSVTFRAPR